VVSANGRFVAFTSQANDLGANDTNGVEDVYLRDRIRGVTELISARLDGTGAGNSWARNPSISADGRFVLFSSAASDLAAIDTNERGDVFVRDRLLATTELVSISVGGEDSADNGSFSGLLSADGSTAVFISSANDLVPLPTPAPFDYYARHLRGGTTELLTINLSAAAGAMSSFELISGLALPSANGQRVVFVSDAEDLVEIPTSGLSNVYVRDRQTSTTHLVSRRANGDVGGNRASSAANISADGQFVAFISSASDLVTNDGNKAIDVFLYQIASGINTLASVVANGMGSAQQGIFSLGTPASIDRAGRRVAFTSLSDDLAPDDNNGLLDVFVFDRFTGRNRLISRNLEGKPGDGTSLLSSVSSFSADGRFLAFASAATDLTADRDVNGDFDVFVRDLVTGETVLASVAFNGGQTADPGGGLTSLSEDGSTLVLVSEAGNLIPQDSNGVEDTFVFRVPRTPVLPIPMLDPIGLFALLSALGIAGLIGLRRLR
jgi:Tol biopolymer transport system component